MNSKVFPNCSHAKCFCSHILAEVVDLIGRHEETRTPDLYRVKLLKLHNSLKLNGTDRTVHHSLRREFVVIGPLMDPC